MSKRNSSAETARRQLRDNGVVLGAILIIGMVLTRLRSWFCAWVFSAPGINLGPRCRINGIRCMRIGRDVAALSGLRLEAVTNYRGVELSPVITIGDRVSFSEGVHITAIDRISIGNDVLFGSHIFVSDHNHGAYVGSDQCTPDEAPAHRALRSAGPVVIEDKVWIGDNVNIVGPVTIGFGSVVAANSVVRADVPARSIVAGAPARVIKAFDQRTMQWRKPESQES